MANGNIKIDLGLDEIVNLECVDTECKHNLHNAGYFSCNLKRVFIARGKCTNKESLIKEEKENN